jgi:hypothetical protein
MVPSEATPGTRWYTVGEILLTGRASAAQRSWIFVELLRQGIYVINADGVITPRPDPHADDPTWEYDEYGNEIPVTPRNPNQI